MTEQDAERYTQAMLALGFASGLCMRMSRDLEDVTEYREDLQRLHKMLDRIVEMNEHAEG